MKALQTPDVFPLDEVVALLRQTDWAQNRPEELTARAMAGSLCFGLQNDAGRLVAFARVVTDGAIFGYLADVVVDEALRGNGVGKEMMALIMAHPTLQSLIRFTLLTGDAHSFYSQFGFRPSEHRDWLMEIFNPPAE